MTRKEIAKRYTLAVISLFFSALGVAFARHAQLGVSPISAVANVLSLRWPSLSLGSWLVIWNCVLIAGQIVILRKDFKVIQLIQIPLSILFGLFTDLCMLLISDIPVTSYAIQALLVVAGILVLAFGICLSVIANAVMNSGEAFVKAIADKTGLKFGNVKIAFDIFCVISALSLSLLFFDFKVEGVREGTLATAVLTGTFVKLYSRHLKSPVEKLLTS